MRVLNNKFYESQASPGTLSQVKKIKYCPGLLYKAEPFRYGTIVGLAILTVAGILCLWPRTKVVARTVEAPVTILKNVRVYDARGRLVPARIAWSAGRLLKNPPASSGGAKTVDGGGGILTPGLIDVNTGLGLVDVSYLNVGREDSGGSDAVRAAFRVSEVFDPANPIIPVARSGGITSALAVPRGGLVSGQSAWIDLAAVARGEHARLIDGRAALHVSLGRTPKITHGDRFLQLRRLFDELKRFRKGDASPRLGRAHPADRLDLAALDRIVAERRPVVFRVHRAAHIRAVLRFAREHKLRPIIAGGTEAWKVAAELAREGTPVVLNPVLNLPFHFDARASRSDAAAILHRAGVPIIFSTFDTHRAGILRQLAGNAVRAGLSHHAALMAVTRNPARAFGMGDRYGTLAAQGAANLVLWSGDPLELSSRVVKMWIQGRPVTLESRQTELLRRYRRLP